MADIPGQRKRSTHRSNPSNAEPPQYQAKTAYVPQATATGLAAAYEGQAKNWGGLATMGAELSQNMGAEMATIQAAKDAQTPGRNLFPSITMADKAYEAAYHKEEYANLASKGQEIINNNLTLAMRDPSPQALKAYEDETNNAIRQLASSATEKNQLNLGRDLGHAYSSGLRQLGTAVYKRNEQLNAQAYAARYNQGERDVYNYALSGQTEEASYVREQLIGDAQNQYEMGKISKGELDNKKLALQLKEEEAREAHEFQIAEQAEKGDEYLAWLKSNDKSLDLGDGAVITKRQLPPDLRDAANHSALRYANEFRKFTDGSRQLEYQAASHAIQEGTFESSELFALKDSLDKRRYEDLRHQLAMQQLKEDQTSALANEMSLNFNNVAGMAQYSGKQKSEVFDTVVETQEKLISAATGEPYKLSLVDQATAALQIKSDIPTLQNRISQSVKYGNPQQMMEGAQAIRILENNNNGVGAKGLDADTRSIASLFDLTSRYTARSPEESATFARDYVVNATPEQRQERVDSYKDWLKYDRKFEQNPGSKLEYIANGLNLKSGFLFKTTDTSKVPLGMSAAFDSLMPLYVSKVGDPDQAAELVFSDMAKVFAGTKINNSDEIMKLPPDKVFQGVPMAHLNRSKEMALSDIIDRNINLKHKGGFVFQELLPLNERKHSNSGDLEVQLNGKKGKVIVQTDYMTELGAELIPSWSFAFIADGTSTPVPLMDNIAPGAQARWAPTPAQFQSFADEEKAEYLKQAEEIKEAKRKQAISNKEESDYYYELREGNK